MKKYSFILKIRLFEEMSIGVLNIFDESSVDGLNGVILLQKIPYYNMNCLEMASESKSQKFLSVTSVQNLLTEIWLVLIAYFQIKIKLLSLPQLEI